MIGSYYYSDSSLFCFLSLISHVVVVIEWQLNIQPHVQSVHITANILSWNHADDKAYSIQHYVIKLPPPIKLTTIMQMK
jgi:hypothetical protein